MSEETTDFITPTVFYRMANGALDVAVVEDGGIKALYLFRDEADAEEYRLKHGMYPAEEGFGVVPLEDRQLRDVIECHSITHVAILLTLTSGEEGADIVPADAFLELLELSEEVE